jgi:hypothetical protein|tara:strand:- start:56 stop:325 length:270 start_codon:yes stop_codon:yes gene_type:complete
MVLLIYIVQISKAVRSIAGAIINVCDAGKVVINNELDKNDLLIWFGLDTNKVKDMSQLKQKIHLQDGLTLMYKEKESNVKHTVFAMAIL